MDENYLIALSNKGTLKRAQKELEGAAIELAVTNDTVEAKFADETILTLTGDIKKYKCSCPARDVCKHLIMTVLAVQKQCADNPENANAEEPVPDFEMLLAETVLTIEKKAGRQITRKAFFQAEIDGTAEIEETSILSITLISSGYKVHFLPGNGMEDSKCTCKTSGICTHKVEALLHYIRFKTGKLPEGMVEKISQPVSDIPDTESLVFMQDFVAEFLKTGLARKPANLKQQFEHLSVIAHSRRFAYLENIAKRIAAQLELTDARSARANTHSLLNNLCEFINVCNILLSGKVSKELLGSFRDEYNLIPPLTLHGLGAEGWYSDTGYTGITSYFYCDERQEIIRYSSVLPVEFKSDFNAIYKHTEIPGVNAYISKMCKSTVKVVSGRLSRRKKLSFTKDTKGNIRDKTTYEFIQSISINDFSQIPNLLWKTDERTIIAVIAPTTYSGYHFDNKEQRVTIVATDKNDKQLQLSLKYKDSDKLLVHNLQKFMNENNSADPMLVKIFVENGNLRLFPLALYRSGSEIINLSLDNL